MTGNARLPDAIVFDVDGTFYDPGPVRRRMSLLLARYCLGSPLAGWRAARLLSAYRRALESLRRDGEANGPARQLGMACAGMRIDPEAARRIVEEWMGERPLSAVATCAREGLREFVEAARARGVPLAVFSDYPALAKVRAFGMEEAFGCVLSAQDAAVGAFKPCPAGLLECLRSLDARPERSIYIGDRPEVDGEAARRAGMRAYIIGLPETAAGDGWTGAPDFLSLRRELGL
ncbi:MAG: HAD family hydrolase [Bryobacteraceae bacterium]|nr:HAD family hydrolase [Bryobacteraceae bacterium]